MVGPKKRELCGVTLNYFYAIGEAFTGLVAWYCRDWVVLQYVVSAPPLLFFIYYWYTIFKFSSIFQQLISLILLRFVPESVRWLLAKNETHEAGKIIRKAAVVNGVVLSNDMQRYLGMVPKSSKEVAQIFRIYENVYFCTHTNFRLTNLMKLGFKNRTSHRFGRPSGRC